MMLEIIDGPLEVVKNKYLINSEGFINSKKPIQFGRVRVGNNENDCDILIPSTEDSDKANFIIEFDKKKSKYFIEIIGSSSFLKIIKPLSLKQNMIIHFTDFNMLVQSLSNNLIELKFIEGPNSNQSYSFTDSQCPIKIGRKNGLSIYLDYQNLSRCQCT